MKKETEDRIKYIDNARTQVLIEYNGKKRYRKRHNNEKYSFKTRASQN